MALSPEPRVEQYQAADSQAGAPKVFAALNARRDMAARQMRQPA